MDNKKLSSQIKDVRVFKGNTIFSNRYLFLSKIELFIMWGRVIPTINVRINDDILKMYVF